MAEEGDESAAAVIVITEEDVTAEDSTPAADGEDTGSTALEETQIVGDEPEEEEPEEEEPEEEEPEEEEPIDPFAELDGWIDPYEGVELHELEHMLKEATANRDSYLREITMFERYVEVNASGGSLPAGGAGGGDESETAPASRKRSKMASRSARQPQEPLRLSITQKCDIAIKEADEIRSTFNKQQLASEKQVAALTAGLEEAAIRDEEITKMQREFARHVETNGLNQHTGQVMAEAVLRYHQDHQRARDTLIDKLKTKATSLKSTGAHQTQQIRRKEHLGDVLHEVDFHQLKIENTQFEATIKEKDKERVALKKRSGDVGKHLAATKDKLKRVLAGEAALQKDIKSREAMLERLRQEAATAERALKNSQRYSSKLQAEKESFAVPSILEYVQEQADSQSLTKSVQTWTRKVEIAKGELKSVKRQVQATANSRTLPPPSQVKLPRMSAGGTWRPPTNTETIRL